MTGKWRITTLEYPLNERALFDDNCKYARIHFKRGNDFRAIVIDSNMSFKDAVQIINKQIMRKD